MAFNIILLVKSPRLPSRLLRARYNFAVKMANIRSPLKQLLYSNLTYLMFLFLSRAVFLKVINKEDALFFGKTEHFYTLLKTIRLKP